MTVSKPCARIGNGKDDIALVLPVTDTKLAKKHSSKERLRVQKSIMLRLNMSFRSLFPKNLGQHPESCNSLESSIFGLEKFTNRPGAQVGPALVPEVVVSHHSSENLEVDEDDYLRREMAHRDQMQKNVQKYLLLTPSTPLKDKLFTAGLLALTMCGILVLFWYQNFGPGFRAFHSK